MLNNISFSATEERKRSVIIIVVINPYRNASSYDQDKLAISNKSNKNKNYFKEKSIQKILK